MWPLSGPTGAGLKNSPVFAYCTGKNTEIKFSTEIYRNLYFLTLLQTGWKWVCKFNRKSSSFHISSFVWVT